MIDWRRYVRLAGKEVEVRGVRHTSRGDAHFVRRGTLVAIYSRQVTFRKGPGGPIRHVSLDLVVSIRELDGSGKPIGDRGELVEH